MDKPIVFLSHSSKDAQILNRLKVGLDKKTNGTIDFFLSSDGESIPFGRNWVSSIEGALDKAKLAFLFLSPNSVSSEWVHFEAGFMYAKSISVVPVAMPPLNLSKVRPPLSLLQGFNIHSVESLNNIFAKLNAEFDTQYGDLFAQSDYSTIFSTTTGKNNGLFGKYERLVEIVLVNFRPPPGFCEAFRMNLEASGLRAKLVGAGDNKEILVSYGVHAYTAQSNTYVRLTPDLTGITFDAFDSANTNQKTPLGISIEFKNVAIHTLDHFRSKLLGTAVELMNYQTFVFNGVSFSVHPSQTTASTIRCSYTGKLKDAKLEELVAILIDAGAIYEIAGGIGDLYH